MKLKLIFATATAVGALMVGGAAYAAGNTLYISQTGGANLANVHQSGAEAYSQIGSNNDIGTLAAPVTQDGNGNYFGYSNAGYGAGTDNDIIALRQHGTNNWVQVLDSNGSAHTRVNNLLEDGTNNQVAITRTYEQSSLIDQVLLNGSNNNVWIRQGPIYRSSVGTYGPGGGNNTISLVQITGSNNGSPTPGGTPYADGIWIQQTGSALVGGSNNKITEASITGSNNPGHFGHAVSIYQEGSSNGITSSTARMIGSNGNSIVVSEIGNLNNFSVVQGLTTSSTGNSGTILQTGDSNSASATQDGSYDTAYVTQTGDDNRIVVTQFSDGNTATANFTGNSNGNGSLTGDALALLALNANLIEGTIYQDSTGVVSSTNKVTYNVTGSSNLFAMAQIGGNNSIVGTVTASSSNQVAVLQKGNGNTTNFTQTGGNSNGIVVSQ